MKYVKFTLSMGFVGADREDIFPYDDDATDENYESDWQTWAWEQISGGWDVVDSECGR